MGFARDLGAAATLGLSATTKKKEAEARYQKRQEEHRRKINSYNDAQAHVQTCLKTMDGHVFAAQGVLISTGALTSDANDNVAYGWYTPQDEVGQVEDNPDYRRATIGAIPAFGLGIGTPALLWTLVSLNATAATGTAIATLSGAAASAATAAWIGRAATLGLGGMTAGRIALGPIGAAASLLTLPLGAAIAGSKERNYIRRTKEATNLMTQKEKILENSRSQLMDLLPRIAVVTADLQKHTTQLETTEPNTSEAQEAVGKLDIDMRKATAIKIELLDILQQRDDNLRANGFGEAN